MIVRSIYIYIYIHVDLTITSTESESNLTQYQWKSIPQMTKDLKLKLHHHILYLLYTWHLFLRIYFGPMLVTEPNVLWILSKRRGKNIERGWEKGPRKNSRLPKKHPFHSRPEALWTTFRRYKNSNSRTLETLVSL